jgi:hypothetical protein
VSHNRVVGMPPEPPQSSHQAAERPDDADATRELPKPGPQSPWSREYAGPVPASPPPPSWAVPGHAPAPTAHAATGQPGPSADWTFPPASQQGWPTASQQGWPARNSRRPLWTGITLVSIAIVATLIAVLVSSTTSAGSPKSSATGGTPLPNPAPSLAPSPTPSPSTPSSPLPSLGAVATPPGLLAIDYHAYRLGLVAPSDIALGPAELVQFKKYGLTRVVGLGALTLGPTDGSSDDYDASINILRFSSPAAAAAELNYSNTQNKQKASTIALPGLPSATAFVNKGDSSTGIGIGAFTTVGRYQVVVILSGLSANIPTNAQVVAAEAAKVMRALLPDAATIVPPASSGGSTGPTVPGFPTPTATGTHA